jgi:LPPG:FO 2-phospho-L-lactate transferase
VEAAILPMTDDPVRTRIRTPDGWLTFQEYFVREKTLVEVLEVRYEGADRALPAPGVVAALREADVVVVCPSNPVTSVGPILAVPGVVEALAGTPAAVVAVSPIIGGSPISGPAGDLMRVRGLPVSPVGIALAYSPWLDVLVLDSRDEACRPAVAERGVRPVLADIVMADREREIAVARRVLQEARP